MGTNPAEECDLDDACDNEDAEESSSSADSNSTDSVNLIDIGGTHSVVAHVHDCAEPFLDPDEPPIVDGDDDRDSNHVDDDLAEPEMVFKSPFDLTYF